MIGSELVLPALRHAIVVPAPDDDRLGIDERHLMPVVALGLRRQGRARRRQAVGGQAREVDERLADGGLERGRRRAVADAEGRQR